MEWMPLQSYVNGRAVRKSERELKLRHDIEFMGQKIPDYLERLKLGPVSIDTTRIPDFLHSYKLSSAYDVLKKLARQDPPSYSRHDISALVQLAHIKQLPILSDINCQSLSRPFREAVLDMIQHAADLQVMDTANRGWRKPLYKLMNSPISDTFNQAKTDRFSAEWSDVSGSVEFLLLPESDRATLLRVVNEVRRIAGTKFGDAIGYLPQQAIEMTEPDPHRRNSPHQGSPRALPGPTSGGP